MTITFRVSQGILLYFLVSAACFAQSASPAGIALNSTNFEPYGDNWVNASSLITNLESKPINLVKGNGIIVNQPKTGNNANLVTREMLGDLDLDLDFMITRNSSSGVFFMGRYEVNLSDSWCKLNPGFDDCGGISPRWDNITNRGYEGIAPLVNVSKAPGLWQHLKVRFRAPKFNEKGEKIVNARFEEVYLNGVLIQQQAEVVGPSKGAILNDEKTTGPLMLQNGTGTVAFKDIIYKSISPPVVRRIPSRAQVNPILLNPSDRPYFLRSFLMYGSKKLTHTISAGNSSQLNYSYDLKQGALLQVWRGQFADVTEMWESRGEPQLARPLGSVIKLSDAPFLAVLPDVKASWPELIPFDDFNNKGYVLDKNRNPTFKYSFKGASINDKISFGQNAQSILREISIEAMPENLYCRLAVAETIEHINKGLYAINNKTYYIKVNESAKPFIRKTQGGEELIAELKKETPFTYSIIW